MSSNTPQLRFAEFSGEWTPSKIGADFRFISTNSLSRDNLNYEEGVVKNIHYGDIHKKFRILFDADKEVVPYINSDISLARIGSDNYLQNGDVVFVDASEDYAETGKCIEVKNTANQAIIAGLHTIHARPKYDNTFAVGFFAYLANTRNVRQQIRVISQGTKVLSISPTTLAGVSTFYPKDTAEQQKIGSFLSAVDSKIEGLEQELGLLKRYKQGIMQRLFNQTLRFKDNHGSPFPAWQDVSIKEIGEVITGSTPSKTNDGFWEGSFPWATAQDFKSKYISTTIQTLSEQGKKKSRIIPKNSVLITCIASIGLNAINKVECATNQQINAIVCNEKYDSEFIYYAIGFNNRSLKNLAGQTAVPIVTKTAFESFRLFVAKDKVEQKKIADFLSAIDEKIEAKQNQITTARNWKKSLLQKMFV